jgi:universal stress protein E
MNALKCIVVCADYSDCSKNAIKEAGRLANWHGAKLVCLHVFEEEIMKDFRHHYELDHSEILKQAREHLDHHVTGILGDQEAENKVVIGYPFKEILREVADNDADLLVLGSRGHRQTDHRKTGFFAAKCIRKAPVEVLLERAHQDGPFKSIVACVDFSETSFAAAERAFEVAVQDGASLELFHSMAIPLVCDGNQLGPSSFMTPIDTEPMIEDAKAKLRSWADDLLKERGGDLDITVTVKEGISAGNVLIKHLHDTEADLAVLGTRGRTGLRKLLLGTTAERLIHEAPCSTLAVKPKDFEYQVS